MGRLLGTICIHFLRMSSVFIYFFSPYALSGLFFQFIVICYNIKKKNSIIIIIFHRDSFLFFHCEWHGGWETSLSVRVVFGFRPLQSEAGNCSLSPGIQDLESQSWGSPQRCPSPHPQEFPRVLDCFCWIWTQTLEACFSLVLSFPTSALSSLYSSVLSEIHCAARRSTPPRSVFRTTISTSIWLKCKAFSAFISALIAAISRCIAIIISTMKKQWKKSGHSPQSWILNYILET